MKPFFILPAVGINADSATLPAPSVGAVTPFCDGNGNFYCLLPDGTVVQAGSGGGGGGGGLPANPTQGSLIFSNGDGTYGICPPGRQGMVLVMDTLGPDQPLVPVWEANPVGGVGPAGPAGAAGAVGPAGPAGPAGVSFEDAPNDGQVYGRQDGKWVAITTSSGGTGPASPPTAPTGSLPTVVQSALAPGVGPIAFPGPVAAGNLLLVCVGSEAGLAPAFTDTLGTVYTFVGLQSGATNTAIYAGVAPQSGANTVAASGFTNQYSWMGVIEVTGQNDDTWLDVVAKGGSPTAQGATLQTASPNELLIVASQAYHNASTFAPNGLLSAIQTESGQDAYFIGSQPAGAAGPVSVSFGGNLQDANTTLLVVAIIPA